MTPHEFEHVLIKLNNYDLAPNKDFYHFIIEPFYDADIHIRSKTEFAKFYIENFPSFCNQYAMIKDKL